MVPSFRKVTRAIALLAATYIVALSAGCSSPSAGNIRGTIIDAFTRQLVTATATVRIGSRQVVTSTGSFGFSRVPAGPREVMVAAPGYFAESEVVEIVDRQTTRVVVELTERPPDGLATVVGRATLVNDVAGSVASASARRLSSAPLQGPGAPDAAAATADAIQVRPTPECRTRHSAQPSNPWATP